MNEHQEYASIALREMLERQQTRSNKSAFFSVAILNRSIDEERRIQEAIEWVERQKGD